MNRKPIFILLVTILCVLILLPALAESEPDPDPDVQPGMITEELQNEAAAHSLPIGKYLLIKYIAETEGISIEEAVDAYGGFSLGELLTQFPDAGYMFEAQNDETDLSTLLTPEQLAALEAAFALQKDAVVTAEKVFHDAFQSIKAAYRDKIHTVKQDKQQTDAAAIQAALDDLKEQMLVEYNSALKTRDEAVAAAKSAFLEAITAAGIPQDLLDSFFNWHLSKELNTQNQLKGFLQEFIYHAQANKPDTTPAGNQEMNGNSSQNGKDNSNSKTPEAKPNHSQGGGSTKDNGSGGKTDNNSHGGGKKK